MQRWRRVMHADKEQIGLSALLPSPHLSSQCKHVLLISSDILATKGNPMQVKAMSHACIRKSVPGAMSRTCNSIIGMDPSKE